MFAFFAGKGEHHAIEPRHAAVLSVPSSHSSVTISGMLVAFLIAMGAVVAVLILASAAGGNPPVAPLGVNGELIDVPPKIFIPGPEKLPNRVFRVDSASPDMPVAKLKLDRGDLIVAIDSMRFTSMAGFRHALWCSSDRPSFLVWRARQGKLTIHNIPYPHRQPDPDLNRPQPPDSYWMSIDIR
jgi:S1-C subfamily serine protease